MPRVPLIGRLFLREYIALFLSFILIGLEGFIRVITLALPQPVIIFFYNRSRSLFDFLSSAQGRRSRAKKSGIVNEIRDASDFVELCAIQGYYAEEHVLQTADGYLLGLHRLGWKKGEEGLKVNSGPHSVKKSVVYLHHGLLMNSEGWVCLTDVERCLPFQLVEKGYDVWLGNNRGNKYSKKSTHRSPTSIEFWNFSMDEFAFHDIPNSIEYILGATGQASLSYIGFSQGSAQAFATLSIHPKLNDHVDVFIALAPAMAPAGLRDGVVNAMVRASPEVIFLAFGRRSILKSVTMWQSILYPPIFVRIIDMAVSFLFGWKCRNISAHQKLAAYPHLYSFSSTKSVVHWFQIIRNQSFQMYDDDVQAPLSIGGGSKYYKVARFPTRNIKTPIVLVYGGCDNLVDIKVMLNQLPSHTAAVKVPHFEHLDFLWGDDVDKHVFPHVFDALESYADTNRNKEKLFSFRTTRFSLNQPPSYSEDEHGNQVVAPGAQRLGDGGNAGTSMGPNGRLEELTIPYETPTGERTGNGTQDTTPDSARIIPSKHVRILDDSPVSPSTPSSPMTATARTSFASESSPRHSFSTPTGSIIPRPINNNNNHPSPISLLADDVPSRPSSSHKHHPLLQHHHHNTTPTRPRSDSFTSSAHSVDSSTPGSASNNSKPGVRAEGITLGIGRATGSVVTQSVEAKVGVPGADDAGSKKKKNGTWKKKKLY